MSAAAMARWEACPGCCRPDERSPSVGFTTRVGETPACPAGRTGSVVQPVVGVGVGVGQVVVDAILLRAGIPADDAFGQAGTFAKRICADGGDAVGDGDVGQARAVKNAPSPMAVTLSGMVTAVRP